MCDIRRVEFVVAARRLLTRKSSIRHIHFPGAEEWAGYISAMNKRKSCVHNVVKPSKTPRTDGKTHVQDEEEVDEEDEEVQQDHSLSASSVGDIGVIESITLRNFMSHHLLGPFKFGPNVNFIVGNNGTGKSAILTALIVGLGGKATTTNRGTSLKGFVKYGESFADIKVKLKNRGNDPYKGDIYGDSICIEHRITSDGCRTCKIKNKIGHVVSTKKEELTAILDHFGIQVLLQCCMANRFHTIPIFFVLKFFMKATLLEQMKRDYIHIKQTKALTREQVERQEECLKDLRQLFLQKKERYECLSSLDNMRQTLEDLKKKMAWCLVRENERHVEQLIEQIEKEESDCKREEKLQLCQNKVTAAEKRLQDIQKKLCTLREEQECLAEEGCKMKEEIKVKTKAQKNQEVVYFRAENKLKQLEKEQCLLQERIHKISNGSGRRSHETEQAQHLKKISAFKKQLEKLEKESSALNQEVKDKQQALLKGREEYDKLREYFEKARARKVMQESRPPKNCREAFTADGDQVFSHRYYTPEHEVLVKYLGGDPEAEIRLVESELENSQAQLSRFQLHLSSVKEDIQFMEEKLRSVIMACKKNQESINKVKASITELENIEEAQAEDISSLEEDAQENEQKIESERRNVKEAQDELKEHERVLTSINQKYKDVKNKMEQLSDETEQLKEEQVKAEAACSKLDQTLKILEKKLEDHQANIQAMKDELSLREEEMQDCEAKAKEICPVRQQVDQSARCIDAQITRLRQKISTEESSHGDKEHVIREYAEAHSNYKSKSSQLRDLRKFIDRLDHIMIDRQDRYKSMRRSLSVRCKLYFNNFMMQLNCSGSMMFDHINESLSISVKPPGQEKNNVNDMRSLSGGERSFSTVCFILALWEITESPFRCLDEFDVYMDMHNRSISMNMLVALSERQHVRQFIFITPQSTSHLPKSAHITIHQLQDPEREAEEE
ncbi:structural maintenance of chromosomes protein 6 [Sinocyclocheilus rhinocerous]|nr:PREDICTED: structural maintenance of chromosomes protein 6-like [Sinocyclocheilus rhinocerous]